MIELTKVEWLQVEQAAKGCVSGTSDEWPALVAVIEKIQGKPLESRKSSFWLRGFCEGVMIQSGNGSLINE